MTKKKKARLEAEAAERQRVLEIERKNREFQERMACKATLKKMHQQCDRIASSSEKYLSKAKEAYKAGDKTALELCKTQYKLTLSRQRILERMTLQFEMALDTNEMNGMVDEFVKGVSTIANQMKNTTSIADFQKATEEFNLASMNSSAQLSALNAFMEAATGGLESLDVGDSGISDKELDMLISNQAADDVVVDKEIGENIDAKIAELNKAIKGE